MKTRISNEVYKMLERNRVDSFGGRKIIEAIDEEYYSMDDFILYITMDIDSVSLKFRTKKGHDYISVNMNGDYEGLMRWLSGLGMMQKMMNDLETKDKDI